MYPRMLCLLNIVLAWLYAITAYNTHNYRRIHQHYHKRNNNNSNKRNRAQKGGEREEEEEEVEK